QTLDLEVLEAFGGINAADPSSIDALETQSAFGDAPAPANLDPLEKLLPFAPAERPWSELQAAQDTFANRAKYPAAAQPEGSFFRATDKLVLWQKRIVSGTPAWVYVAGIWRDTL